MFEGRSRNIEVIGQLESKDSDWAGVRMFHCRRIRENSVELVEGRPNSYDTATLERGDSERTDPPFRRFE